MSRRDPRQGLTLFVVLLAGYLAVLSGRECLRHEGPPAFVVSSPHGIWIDLGDGFPVQGAQQIFDALLPAGAKKLTIDFDGFAMITDELLRRPLESGERLDILPEERDKRCLRRSWMTAAQRIALGIPLHPDRMKVADWECLPGIGPGLAQRIEANRQKNGDFGPFENLQRVKGIGAKRLAAVKEFF